MKHCISISACHVTTDYHQRSMNVNVLKNEIWIKSSGYSADEWFRLIWSRFSVWFSICAEVQSGLILLCIVTHIELRWWKHTHVLPVLRKQRWPANTHTHTHTHTHTRTHTRTRTHAHTHMHTHTHAARAHAHSHTHTQTQTHTHARTLTHTDTHTHTHTHTNTHVHARTLTYSHTHRHTHTLTLSVCDISHHALWMHFSLSDPFLWALTFWPCCVLRSCTRVPVFIRSLCLRRWNTSV